MGETLNGNTDLSSTNGFTSKVDQTGPGWPANMAGPGGAWATQRAEWAALVRARGFDPNNYSSQLGAPERNIPTNVYANPGKAVETPNAETPLTKDLNGNLRGRIPGTTVVVNLPG